MKKIALVLDQSFPSLDGKIRSKLIQILKYLPCMTVFLPQDEDAKNHLNYCNKYDIQQLNEANLLTDYQYKVILHGKENYNKLTSNEFSVTYSKCWRANLMKVLQQILFSDQELLVENMELMSWKNFLSKFYKRTEILDALNLSFGQIVDICNLNDFDFMMSLEAFLKSEDQHLALVYKPRYYSKDLFYHTLHKSLLDSEKNEDILFAEIDYVPKNKSLVFKIKNSFGPEIGLENIKGYLERENKELLLVINYKKIDLPKIEKIRECLWDHGLDLPYKILHLINEEHVRHFSKFDFNEEEEFGKLDEVQVFKNLIRSIPNGELDKHFVINNPKQLELLKIPTFLKKSVNNMKSRIFGFSSVFPDYFYKSVMTKYFPNAQKTKYLESLLKNIEQSFINKSLPTTLELEKVSLKAGDQEFELSLTYLIYSILKRNSWERFRDQLSYLHEQFPSVSLWSNTLYLADLVQGKKLKEFEGYLLWRFDEQLISSVFRFNSIFKSGKFSFIIDFTEENSDLGYRIHKIVVKDLLNYGFYRQAGYLLSRIKKFYEGERHDLLTNFSKQLYNMTKNFSKFDEVRRDDYFELYEYYLAVGEYAHIEEMLDCLPVDSPIFSMEIREQTKSLTDLEKIIVRELFYRFVNEKLKKMSLEVVRQCMEWYGDFCLKENFLVDYTIMIGYLYEKMIYNGQDTSKMNLPKYLKVVDQIEEKLDRIGFK